MTMAITSDEADEPRPYPGEDLRPTSSKELAGFYAYSWAAEVFVVCGLGAFIPITLEDLARASATAVLASDRSQPCVSPDTATTTMTAGAETAPRHTGEQCVFTLWGAEINTASFALYTFSVSVLLQALVVVTMSGAADHGRYRKKLLLGFAFVGAVATMMYLFVTPTVYFLGSILAMVGNVCFGASFVLLNSFLPLLVRHHPSVKNQHESRTSTPLEECSDDAHRPSSEEPIDTGVEDSTAALLPAPRMTPSPHPSQSTSSTAMQLSTKISSYGVGIGYISSVLVQFLSLIILQSTGATPFSLRLVLFLIGLWWFVFTIPAAICLRPRPGPPLVWGHTGARRSWYGYITYSWIHLGRTVLRARRLRDVLLFLAAWFLVSDALATVSGTAILFAKTTLAMDSAALAWINVTTMLSGICGAWLWSRLGRAWSGRPTHTVLACIALFELIPLYGLLGFVPAVRRLGVGGLQQPWEMYPLGAVYGIVLGGLSSHCRSLFAWLVPPGQEAAFYALYAVTDKGSSVFGPAVVGAIADATGDIRPAFFFLAVLVALPMPILWLVDLERGKREAVAMARDSIRRDVTADADCRGEGRGR